MSCWLTDLFMRPFTHSLTRCSAVSLHLVCRPVAPQWTIPPELESADISVHAVGDSAGTGVISAVSESGNKDSAASCSGIERAPRVTPAVSGLNDSLPAGGEASEDDVGLAADTVSADEPFIPTNGTDPNEGDSAPSCSGVGSCSGL